MKAKTKSLTVRLHDEHYPFIVGMDLERDLVKAVAAQGERRVAVIADTTTAKLHGRHVMAMLKKTGRNVELFTFPAGERHKHQQTVTRLQHALLKRRYGRDTLILALGGGIVGDVAGFVAATYMRGVPYIQVPTTILAMVDSSVGGKVGVDTPYGKNTVGAFHQPRAVIADLRFLAGLPRQHVINGLLEAIKKFITSDKASLALAEKLDLEHPLKTPQVLQEIILRSVRGKAQVIERDEEEKNQRKVLNFGHTIGHALELLSDYRLLHGYGVGYGILVETQIATFLGLLPESERAQIEDYLGQFGIKRAALKKYPIEKIIAATRSDKKARGGRQQYVLLRSIGSVYHERGYAHPVGDVVVRKALTRLWRAQ